MKKIRTIETDVLVIGSGGAGLRAAIEARDKGADVIVITRSKLGAAHTSKAEGGINAALGNVDPKDNWKVHLEDTLKEGCFISDRTGAEILAREAPGRILDLVGWGVKFRKNADGKIDQVGPSFGNSAYRRTCYSDDFSIGSEIMGALAREMGQKKIKILEENVATSILTKKNKVVCVTIIDFNSGEFFAIEAKAIVIATGGYSSVYKTSTYGDSAFGDGIALAYKSGAELIDMEFVQFQPMDIASPKTAGKVKGLAAHYALGGIKVDYRTASTGVAGIFAAGEATGGLHGANRLGGNSLADTQVFGRIAGNFAAAFAKKNELREIDEEKVDREYERIMSPFKQTSKLEPSFLKKEIRELMWNYAGVSKNRENLEILNKKLNDIENMSDQICVKGNPKKNHEWLDFFDLHNMITCCKSVVKSSLLRKETRGAYFRIDYPERNDKKWMAHIICKKDSDGGMKLSVENVRA